MQNILITTLTAALLLAGGCVHHPDIQQGNLITPEMRERIQPGMSMQQVRAIMGTPLVVDPFHPERWYYQYEYIKDAELAARYTLRLDFDERGSLASISGDIPPEGLHGRLSGSEPEAARSQPEGGPTRGGL
jgi:outer membrane protein assembly factor BamE